MEHLVKMRENLTAHVAVICEPVGVQIMLVRIWSVWSEGLVNGGGFGFGRSYALKPNKAK